MGIGEQYEFEKTGRIDPEPSKNRIFGNQGLGFNLISENYFSFICPKCNNKCKNPYGCECGYVNTDLTRTQTPGFVGHQVYTTVGYNEEIKWTEEDCWSLSKVAIAKHYVEPWPTDEEGSLINNRKVKPVTIGSYDYV